MSDHNFEKQIQQKLNELKIPPAERVWSAVEAEIRKDKRRRRGLIIFPFLLLLLAGGGYFVYQNMLSSQSTAGSKSFTANIDSHNNDSISGSSKAVRERATHDQKRDENNNEDRQQITSDAPGTTADLSKNGIKQKKIESKLKPDDEEFSENVRGPEKKLSKNDNAINDPKKNTVADNKPRRDKNKGQQDPINNQLVIDKNIPKATAATTIDQKGKEKERAHTEANDQVATTGKGIESKPEPLATVSVAATVDNRITDSANNTVKQKPVDSLLSNTIAQEKKGANKKTKQSNWKWGANAAAGVSNFAGRCFFGYRKIACGRCFG